MNNYFDYPVPPHYELQEIYLTPYRFSDELRDYVNYMFSHPTHNKHFRLYGNLVSEFDSNDMLKRPYLMYRYFLDNPQRFEHKLENLTPVMMAAMWQTFTSLHKLRGVQFKKFYPASMKLLVLANSKFLDILMKDVKDHNIIYHGDDMVKERKGKTLRERSPASMKEGSKHFEYLCSLD